MIQLPSPRDTCDWILSGPTTYRLSSRKRQISLSPKIRVGGNLQNKSNEVKVIYIPDEGKSFVQVDQSGAEAKVVAYLTRKGNFRALFDNKIKPHSFVAAHIFKEYWRDNFNHDFYDVMELDIVALKASEIFQKFLKLIKTYDRDNLERPYYYIGKKTCHSANYKMMENTFAIDVLRESGGKIRLTLSEAKKFLGMYHFLFPEIRQWHAEVEQTLDKTKLLRNLQGYPRQFTNTWSEGLIREAVAFVPQSTVGTITNIAITNMQNFIEDHKKEYWDVLQNGHDSMLLQCPDADIKECAIVAKGMIEQTLASPRGETFKMESEVSVGKCWSKYNEQSCPMGMKEFITQ